MVWPFKKKSKKSGDKFSKKYNYRVSVSDPMGNSSRQVSQPFMARKDRDEDGVQWLINEEVKFKEIFPLDNDKTFPYKKEEVIQKIRTLEKQPDEVGVNPLNKQKEIYKWKKILTTLEYPNGSFLKIDWDGVPHIEYVRYRSSFVPLKRNIDFATVHVPSESLVKNVLTSVVEKSQKYKQNKDKFLAFIQAVGWIILLVGFGLNIWWANHLNDTANESSVAKLQQRIDEAPLICAELYGQAGDNFLTASKNAVDITQQLHDQLNPTVTKNLETQVVR